MSYITFIQKTIEKIRLDIKKGEDFSPP